MKPRSTLGFLLLVVFALGCASSGPKPPADDPRSTPPPEERASARDLTPAEAGEATDGRAARTVPIPSSRPRGLASPALRSPARRAPATRRLYELETRDIAETMRVHFIDVGKGDATLFEYPCGVVLADTGGETFGDFRSNDLLDDYLEAFFDGRPGLEREIDLLILTHPHIDHTRGAELVRTSFSVRAAADNAQMTGSGSSQQNKLREWAEENASTTSPCSTRRSSSSSRRPTT